jgi:DNA-binding transcriptional MocR family regulator
VEAFSPSLRQESVVLEARLWFRRWNRKAPAVICDHLRRSRAVACDPSQIVVVNGSQQALDLIARVLVDRRQPVAIEDPSYQGTREGLRFRRRSVASSTG